MITAKEVAYHAARERACRDNAARAADEDTAARHHALAELHAARQRELEEEAEAEIDADADWRSHATTDSPREQQSISLA